MGHTIQTVVDIVQGLRDSVTNAGLDAQTKSNVSNDSGTLVETGLLITGRSRARCDGGDGSSFSENGNSGAGGNHGGGDTTNGHLRLHGEALLLQGAEHGVFVVELIDSQALQALLGVRVADEEIVASVETTIKVEDTSGDTALHGVLLNRTSSSQECTRKGQHN